MTRATVSVVIPCYNAERFLGEALAGVQAQTHPPLETIVVDDGSTDSSAAVAERFPSVRVLRQANAGVAAARSRGLAAARGEWVAFLDADDRWRPAKLARQLARAAEGFDFVYCDSENFGEPGFLPATRSAYSELPEGDVFRALVGGNFVTTSGVLARRSLLQAGGPFEARFSPAEDWAVWLRLAGAVPFGCVREVLVDYRVHAAGISRNTGRMLEACRRVILHARTLPGAGRVQPGAWRATLARTQAVAGLSYELSGQAGRACGTYLAALRLEPWRWKYWKFLARCTAARAGLPC